MSTIASVVVVVLPMASSALTGWLWGYDRGEAKGFWGGLEAGRREAEYLGCDEVSE